MKQAHALKVAEVVPQGSDAVLLRFSLDDAQRPHFNFKPGQYLTLEGGPENDRQWRCYSITSDPDGACQCAGAPLEGWAGIELDL